MRVQPVAGRYGVRPSAVGLAAVVALGAAVRVAAVQANAAHPCFAHPDPAFDEALYRTLGAAVARGELPLVAHGQSSTAYPLWLGLLYAAFGDGPAVAVPGNVVLGCATILLVFVAARDLLRSRSAGLLAAAGVALYGPLVAFDASALKVSLGVFLAALALVLYAGDSAARGAVWSLALGVVAALAADVNRLVLAPFVLLLAVWTGTVLVPRPARDGRARVSRPRAAVRAAALVAGFAIAAATLALVGGQRPGDLAAHAAVHLHVGNHRGASGGYDAIDGVLPSAAGHMLDARRVAERAAGRPLDALSSARFWIGRSAAFAIDRPTEWLGLLRAKLARLVAPAEIPSGESLLWPDGPPRVVAVLPGFTTAAVLAVAGALVLGRSAVPLGAAALAYASGLLLFFVTARYRVTLALGLWPLAAGGFVTALRSARAASWRRLAIWLLAVASLAAIAAAGAADESRAVADDRRVAEERVARCELRRRRVETAARLAPRVPPLDARTESAEASN